MSSKITSITSSAHFRTVLSSSTYVVVDFYADWCGPCKVIAPEFNNLANAESKPGKLIFAKVDVDSQKDVAQTHGVNAMPTFLVFKNGSVINTIRGANPSALRAAVMAASKAAQGGHGANFKTGGSTLGSAAARPTGSAGHTAGGRLPPMAHGGYIDTIVRFVGLYVTTLFALDPIDAAERSAYREQTANR